MKKILFLDFDGVLNTEKYQRQLRTEGRSAWDGYGPLFDPEAVENLRMILDTTGAEIIVSSSWKLEGLGKMRSLWRDRSLPGKVAGITPDTVFNPDLLSMDLEGPEVFTHLAGKGNEVRMWLEDHPGEVRYAILDDVPEQEPFYVMTDPRTGITTEIALKVIDILNGQA